MLWPQGQIAKLPMHSAPSVPYPVGRSAFWGLVLGTIWCSGALLVGAWCYVCDSVSARHWLTLAMLVLCGVLALAGWWKSPAGILSWDGQQWCWSAGQGAQEAARSGTLVVALDLQRRMLLRLQPERGAPLWLCAEQALAPARWQALRRAVYSRASTVGLTRPGPAPDSSLHDRHF